MAGRGPPNVGALADAVRRGETWALSRAITLVESTAAAHWPAATELLERVLTFIEALGVALTARGERLAVLAIDPSSPRSGGAILGDKTRMSGLAASPLAYVRPTPSAGALGGVARRTDEAVVLVEAAGYPTVLVESVGVGQSEAAAASVADALVLLVPPAAGDGLQAAKRGLLDLADIVVVHKAAAAPGAGAAAAAATAAARRRGWRPRVVLCDSAVAVAAAGRAPPPSPSPPTPPLPAAAAADAEAVLRPIDVWDAHVLPLWRALSRPPAAALLAHRAASREAWAVAELRERLAAAAAADGPTAAALATLRPRLARGEVTPRVAAARLADVFLGGRPGGGGEAVGSRR
ncbi:hypothetical protein BU14_0350s0003 [Porphyra umbilicalis]|uniref:LAO/AO transport system ATPase n=1 Tax=Porphyra umbilicalis TaxID=2786 RepID=A0A1X6NXZ1_PORUM|nr:hypothetical protein BU14_0350s0003 [Porphyra umbilicalis]|eukprot:OSX73410.1 hypothetical protein BU14_0350s0003 [Porphyra umbilicalis]